MEQSNESGKTNCGHICDVECVPLLQNGAHGYAECIDDCLARCHKISIATVYHWIIDRGLSKSIDINIGIHHLYNWINYDFTCFSR